MEEKINKLQTNFIPILIVLTLVVVFFVSFFVIKPLFKDNAEKKKEIELKKENLSILIEKEKRLKELSSKTQEIESDTQIVESALPNHQDKARLYVQFERIASASGVEIKSVAKEQLGDLSMQEGAVIIPGVNELTFTIEVNGHYENVKNFLINMHKGLRILKIEKFAFKKNEDDFDLANLNTIQATISLKTYYKMEEGENNEAEK